MKTERCRHGSRRSERGGIAAATILFAALAGAWAQNGAPADTMAAMKSSHADLAPISAIGAHVCDIHFYSGNMKRQLIAQHYCSHLSDDILQCVLYDSDKRDARLIGVEYIVSARIFESLPADEKTFWHSQNYEVKSGALTAPGADEAAERDLMKVLIGTYGKTWQTWQLDRGDKLPLGIPQLMMAFTKDGQLDPKIAAERDKLCATSMAAKLALILHFCTEERGGEICRVMMGHAIALIV